MSAVAEIAQNMTSRFNADAAAGLDLVFGFKIEDDESFYLMVKDGVCSLDMGESLNASVTLLMNTMTLTGISTGDIDGMQAFMNGQLRTEGDMMLALKLSELFPAQAAAGPGKTAEIAQNMKSRFNSPAASGLDLVFGFKIEDGENFHLLVKNGSCTLHMGESLNASVTLLMNTMTLTRISTGQTDGMQAFMGGQLRAEGDMMLALKLGDLFPA